MASRRLKVKVAVQCVSCNERDLIGEGEVEAGEHPTCKKCGSPMAVKRAYAAQEKER